MEKIDLQESLAAITEYWKAEIVGELNNQYVKLAKLKGEFIWHHHKQEDELFMVVQGRLTIRLRDRDIELEQGQFFIVPRGVEHLPVANEEVHILLFEPKTVINTGDKTCDMTINNQ
jgi:mannose-6-phosphate isomerase-like protein (cupin superfamily)